MANRGGKKGKKPLQTTLGKASCLNEKEVDLSHVQKPIHTSIFGLQQVLSLFQTATEEVQNYVTHECDIMYECRICRTIFRSLANFILHKRNYCRERFNHLDLLDNETIQEDECAEDTEKGNVESRSATPDHKVSMCKDAKRNLAPIIEKLKEKHDICRLADEALTEDLSSKGPDVNYGKSNDKSNSNHLLLEKIATSNAAVFQTVLQNLPKPPPGKTEYMKSEVMEIHGILESDEAVLGPDGKICTFKTNKVNENPLIPKGELFCTKCNLKFSTKKTLTYHIKYKHNNTHLVFVCPDCKDTFANAWCVYRHLYKIHRRTSAQIKRMREQIHNSCVRRDQGPVKKKDKKNQEKLDKADEENQWLSNIEGDNYFQMCGGCGKRFERKAALHSHAQMCTKRIAVCNTIKENNAKKKEEVSRENKSKPPKVEKCIPSEIIKGSLKRKPYLLRTYKTSDDKQTTGEQKINPIESFCDVNANCEIMESNCDSNKVKEEVEDVIENRNSPSGQDLSPHVKDLCHSPSVDMIDTEKMLNIIGVSSVPEDLEVKNDNESCSQIGFTEDTSSQTAIDFDIFCKNISVQLAPSTSEESSCQKPTRTVPLILRKRNSSKPERKNIILDQKHKASNANTKQDPNQINACLDKTNLLGDEVVPNTNEPCKLDKLPSTSSFRISVKSLEDLIATKSSDKNFARNSGIQEATDSGRSHAGGLDIQCINNVNSEKIMSEDVSNTIKANISPEKLPKMLKRKRTGSFDYTGNKSSEEMPKCHKQNISFISKASPYMDQSNLLCIPCQLSYTTLSKLLWHMSAHFSWFRFQCSRCSFISFNKFDCANHARRSHNVKKRSMQSVVLPIPNWKTVLMAHDFSMLKDENDLSGKHTDEIISGNQEDTTIVENDIKKREDQKEDVSDWDGNLFLDTNCLDSDQDNYNDYSSNDNIKQECIMDSIDIVDDIRDSHQVEVPQEIYTLDVSEIMCDITDREERHYLTSHVKMENFYDEEDSYMPVQKENNATKEIKSEINSDDEIADHLPNAKSDVRVTAVGTKLKKNTDTVINIRPTRNRIRSIKTLQDDFFYDFKKVVKLNDNSINKTTLQRHKKNNHGISHKNAKESVSSSSKAEAKQLRVYSKKK